MVVARRSELFDGWGIYSPLPTISIERSRNDSLIITIITIPDQIPALLGLLEPN